MQKDQNQERGNLPASEKMLWDYLLIIVFVTESENWITNKKCHFSEDKNLITKDT